MILSWTNLAWESYLYWQANDRNILKKINILIKDIQRTPFEGLGKPEPLKFDLAGKWSRKINDEHRLVYEIKNREIIIFQGRYHYI
ncbi:MAG TPA: Txe/YoeB family addiction module toxin [Gammaproteobacteria bacterium]|nr:Txe/YoeB family addiction module toxin [Gammaproteobacteria bacterium]